MIRPSRVFRPPFLHTHLISLQGQLSQQSELSDNDLGRTPAETHGLLSATRLIFPIRCRSPLERAHAESNAAVGRPVDSHPR